MGPNHEAYGTELAVITRGLLLVQWRGEGQNFTLFTDSQAAIRLANDSPRPGL